MVEKSNLYETPEYAILDLSGSTLTLTNIEVIPLTICWPFWLAAYVFRLHNNRNRFFFKSWQSLIKKSKKSTATRRGQNMELLVWVPVYKFMIRQFIGIQNLTRNLIVYCISFTIIAFSSLA